MERQITHIPRMSVYRLQAAARTLHPRRSYASSSSCGPTFEEAVEVAGDVASQAAFDLSAGLSFGGAASDVVAGGWLVLDLTCSSVFVALEAVDQTTSGPSGLG